MAIANPPIKKGMKDKVVIITGSSIGIGRVMAREMLKQGAKVVLNARNAERLERTYQQLSAEGFEQLFAVAGDVSKVEDCQHMVQQTIDHFGRLDVLVNNAGISMEGKVADLQPEVFRKVMEVNYLGSVYPTQAALPQLKANKGSVIFIGSVAGFYGLPKFSVYSSSKNALTSLAESLRIELVDTGVHVGICYVGFTENDPEKTIYDAQGNIIAQPKRGFIKAEPPENVAHRVIKMIKTRRFKHVFTLLGKLNNFNSRFFPALVNFVLTRNFKKQGK